MSVQLFPSLQQYCDQLLQEFDQIPAQRQTDLQVLSQYLSQQYQNQALAQAIVICTHNSRRSHLGQLWLSIGSDYFNLPPIASFSGGTEATAFNPRAVAALQRLGLLINSSNEEAPTNPRYHIRWTLSMSPYVAFSKTFDQAPNPTQDFVAIMVCSEADAGCPFVPGAQLRLALPYDDPKAFDDTKLEAQKYDERCRQIGREFLYALSICAPDYSLNKTHTAHQ